MRKTLAAAVVMSVILTFTIGTAWAGLTTSFQTSGKVNWSLDAVGSNSTPVGTVGASVPCGSSIVKANLYSSRTPVGSAATPTVTLDATTYSGPSWTPLGANNVPLQAYRADVTSQVASKFATSCGAFSFTVTEAASDNFSVDGEVLAIIYSNPLQLEDRTVAFLDGFSSTTGDSATFAFASPVSKGPGFEALMSLGIGYGFQSSWPAVQFSTVSVNGLPLTACAGGQDDGVGADGGLITVGGLGDSTGNTTCPPTAGPGADDELYNVEPFIMNGDTTFTVMTLNPSTDDNIFFLGLNITAIGAVVPPDGQVPEPSVILLMGTGFLGLAAAGLNGTRRRANLKAK